MSEIRSGLARALGSSAHEGGQEAERDATPMASGPAPPPGLLQRTSPAMDVPGRWAAVDIPGTVESSPSFSLSRQGSGVFGASPAWDTPSSYDNFNSYGTSPLVGTPFPYLVRMPGPRHPPHHPRAARQSLDYSTLPVQHEAEEEGQEEESATAAATLASAAAAALQRPPPYPRPAALPNEGEATGTPTSGLTAKQGSGLREPLLPHADPGPGSGGGAGTGVHAAGVAPGTAKGRRGGGLQAMPHTPLSRSLVFGMINAVAAIPTLIAFAAIVFKEPVYAPWLDLLCKFFFLASALHQAVFCLLSSLPYAIGQVQDVGLIFLSAMASSIALLCEEAGRDAATALGTSLLTMTVCTFLVGLGTLGVAKFRLAGLVQYLPLPVVGGYLGFVGYFCIASGIGLGCGVEIDTIPSWAGLASWAALGKLLPTLASCAAFVLTMEHITHPLGLPAVMVAINLAFHGTLLALGMSLEQAQAAGWAMPASEGEQKFWDLWGLFNIQGLSLEGICLGAAARQVGKFFGLFLVVCFGSCMDIAAIQQGTPQKIDFDRELATVAVANMVTGVAGCGYTGSYIFSQTVFTMRAGVFSRWNGVVVAASELVLFALPFSVVQYMPNFFFGALLLWFGLEISRDWLILSYRKVTLTEYILLWLSFATIMQLGLEVGIGGGIIMAVLYFAYAYAKSQVTSLGLVHPRSGVVRTLEQQAALDLFDCRLVAARLRGFVFFGSANSIGIKLHEAAQALVEGDMLVHRAQSVQDAMEHSRRSVGEGYEALKLTQAREALTRAPSYMILDFTHVTGLDATGARTFGMLFRDLLDLDITPLVTGLRGGDSMRQLLEAHGAPLARTRWPPPLPAGPAGLPAREYSGLTIDAFSGSGDLVPARAPTPTSTEVQEGEEEGEWRCCEFPTLEEGLRFAEDQFLEVAVGCGLCPSPTARVTLEALLRSHLQKVPFATSADPSQMAHSLLPYMRRRVLAPGESLWERGDPARECYIIEKGAVRLITFHNHLHLPEDVGPAGSAASESGPQQAAQQAEQDQADTVGATSTHEYGPGCVVGALDLYLHRPRASRAVATSAGGARLLRLSSAKLGVLAAEAPQALNLVQAVLMRAVCRDLSVAMEPTAPGD